VAISALSFSCGGDALVAAFAAMGFDEYDDAS
jgi:hypothetical protein